ncbi:MAG: N-acetylmuramoyl-L-alanine amidase [Victivallales bacterium]
MLEKNLNLSMALKLRAALRKLGFQVIMTRGADCALFHCRAGRSFPKKYKPDLFISIHCNAAAQKTISGIETFAMTPNGCASPTTPSRGIPPARQLLRQEQLPDGL